MHTQLAQLFANQKNDNDNFFLLAGPCVIESRPRAHPPASAPPPSSLVPGHRFPACRAPPSAAMAEHDLTHALAPCLDRHLVFPLLEFLAAKGTYDEKSIQAREWGQGGGGGEVGIAPHPPARPPAHPLATAATHPAPTPPNLPPGRQAGAARVHQHGRLRGGRARDPARRPRAGRFCGQARGRDCPPERAAGRRRPGGRLPAGRSRGPGPGSRQGRQRRLPAGSPRDRPGPSRVSVRVCQVSVRLRQLWGGRRVPVPLPARAGGGGWSGGVGAGAWARGRGRWDRPAQHSPSFPPLPCTARWAPTGST